MCSSDLSLLAANPFPSISLFPDYEQMIGETEEKKNALDRVKWGKWSAVASAWNSLEQNRDLLTKNDE